MEGMIDVAHEKLRLLSQVAPSGLHIFGVVGTTQAKFCAEHAKEGMAIVQGERWKCGHRGCIKSGWSGTKKAKFCSPHAKKGMVRLRGHRCGQQGCTSSMTSLSLVGAASV